MFCVCACACVVYVRVFIHSVGAFVDDVTLFSCLVWTQCNTLDVFKLIVCFIYANLKF